jgi:FkbM family methyltransferase
MVKKVTTLLYYLYYLVLIPLVSKFVDPLIVYELNGRKIKLPISHRLPFYIHLNELYSQNVGRIGKIIRSKYKNLSAIEVGANVGDTITIMRSFSKYPILGIEGDSRFFKILAENTKYERDVFIENYFLSDKEEETRLEFRGGFGTGGLTEGKNNIMVRTLDGLLEDRAQFINAKYLITDTDGFDFNVLRGAINFIKKSKPVIFFEYDPCFILNNRQDAKEIFRYLLELGYRYYLIYDNTGDLIYALDMRKDRGFFRLLRYFYSKDNKYYADIVAFHTSELALFLCAVSSEDKYYNSLKNYN